MRDHRHVTAPSPALTELAHSYGIATHYTDWRGRPVDVPADAVSDVLAAMDVDVSDPERALADRWAAPWRRMLPPCVVVAQGEHRTVPVHVPHGDPAAVSLALEAGGERELGQTGHWVDPREVDGALVGEATFEVPSDLPLGYHTLTARSGDRTARSTLIVTPAWLGLPERMRDRRSWGLAAQLYSVRSRRSWGVGDLVDLADLAVWSAADLGADYLLVNPLHAAEPVAPLEPSPYLPTSRRFFNPLYLRVERIAEYGDLPAADRARVDALAQGVHRELDDADVIDRDTAWTAKRAALLLVHAVPRSAGREVDLRGYRARHGRALRDFATWSVIAQEHGNDARDWPAALQDVDSREVAAFAAAHQAEVDFESWLQWVLDEQLQHAQGKAVKPACPWAPCTTSPSACTRAGPTRGGSGRRTPPGSRSALRRTRSTRSARTGASRRGARTRLEELAYAPFRDLIAAVLRHAGGVRVDHIIGLFRLWWIPAGRPPSEGTYVHYDHEAMIGVLALEAQRAGAVVVGEDLGVVEPSARDYLRSRGILGTSILWFERDGRAGRCPPSGGASCAWPRSPPTTCRRARATSPASTSPCGTGWAC